MARDLFDELGIKPVIPESATPGVLRSAGDVGLEVVSGGLKGLTAFRPSRVLGSVLQLPAAVASLCRA